MAALPIFIRTVLDEKISGRETLGKRREKRSSESRGDDEMRDEMLLLLFAMLLFGPKVALILTMVLRSRETLHESKVPRGLQQQHQLQVAITETIANCLSPPLIGSDS